MFTILAKPWTYLLDKIVSLRASKYRSKIPRFVRTMGYVLLPRRLFEVKTWELKYSEILKNAKTAPIRTPITLGIIKNIEHSYTNYEAACLELGVPYKIVEITNNSWIKNINDSRCDAFLVWPSSFNIAYKKLFDDHLFIMVQEMNKMIFPSYKALWLNESKQRMHDWLVAHNVPHPKTSVFIEKDQAESYVDSAKYPLVFKTDLGACASGVEIVANKKAARRLIDICFGRGYLRKKSISNDRQQGFILFQEFIPDLKEWRMIRLGNSFFGHQKLRKGKFHSGSKLVGWHEPPSKLLDFCKAITEKGNFTSMDIDIFETSDGKYLVNELQAMFGSINASQMYINGKPGRFLYDEVSKAWKFEEGYYCQNASCNLRVKTLLEQLGQTI